VRRNLDLYGQAGLDNGVLHNHMQFQPVISIAPDGRTANLRSRAFSMMGNFGQTGTWMGGLYENEFVKENGVWKFKKDHVFNTYFAPYASGWKPLAARAPPGITAATRRMRRRRFASTCSRNFLPPFCRPRDRQGVLTRKKRHLATLEPARRRPPDHNSTLSAPPPERGGGGGRRAARRQRRPPARRAAPAAGAARAPRRWRRAPVGQPALYLGRATALGARASTALERVRQSGRDRPTGCNHARATTRCNGTGTRGRAGRRRRAPVHAPAYAEHAPRRARWSERLDAVSMG
jgi:hypothetical protein